MGVWCVRAAVGWSGVERLSEFITFHLRIWCLARYVWGYVLGLEIVINKVETYVKLLISIMYIFVFCFSWILSIRG